MKFNLVVSLLCCALLFLGAMESPTGSQQGQSRPSLSERIDHARSSVVRISVEFDDGQKFFGSGFVVNKDGYVITANHVVNPPGKSPAEIKKARISVDVPLDPFVFGTGGTFVRNFTGVGAKIVDSDKYHDVAILAAPGICSIHIPLMRDKTLAPKVSPARLAGAVINDGDPVFVSGYPLSFPVMITNSGFVASSIPIERDQANRDLLDVYWLDMQANRGNSGGPVFSLDTGNVVGIQVAVIPTPVQFMDPPNEDASVPVLGPDGKITGSRVIGYNSGIAEVIGFKYIERILIKNAIPF